MRILNIAGMSLVVFSNLCFLYYLISEIYYTIKRKKSTDDDFIFDDGDDLDDSEEYIPKLSGDALQKLKPGRESCFVDQEILPAVPRILSFLTVGERDWVSRVLRAFIGIVLETAPDLEKDFTTVLELLENAEIPEYADEDWKSATELFLEEYKELPYYRVYESFRKYCPNKEYILAICTRIMNTICVNLYGYVPITITAYPLTELEKGKKYE